MKIQRSIVSKYFLDGHLDDLKDFFRSVHDSRFLWSTSLSILFLKFYEKIAAFQQIEKLQLKRIRCDDAEKRLSFDREDQFCNITQKNMNSSKIVL
jgi:hypothetical protein